MPVYRVLVNREHIEEYSLPEAFAKEKDTRTQGVIAKYGRATQVELDAMPSTVILRLLRETVSAATGPSLNSVGFPILPDVDAQEKRIKTATRGFSL